jgi:DNA polymerase-3 subunit delta'
MFKSLQFFEGFFYILVITNHKMKFQEIPGFIEEKKRLIDAYKSNVISHAQLFFGLEGSPNLSLVLAFSTYINCENKSDNDSCGECSSCYKMKKLTHPDVNFIFPVAPTPSIKKEVISDKYINKWREVCIQDPYMNINDWFEYYGFENKQPNISKDESRSIIKKLSLKPFEAKHKITILWLPEYLHLYTANALLKILEEPPNDTLFFLVTNNYQKLIKTILSRVQLFKVRQFSDDEMKQYFATKEGLLEEEINQIIFLSEGNLNQANRLTQGSSEDELNHLMLWMRSCYIGNFVEIQKEVEWFNDLSKIKKRAFLTYTMKLMREALVIKIDSKLSKIIESEQVFISKFQKTLSLDSLEKIILEVDESILILDRNANPKILFLDLSLEISNLFQKVKN